MKLTAREKELREQYSKIYKNLKIKFPKTNDYIIDEVTGIGYCPDTSDDRKLIRDSRALITLITIYRKDFPNDWEDYISDVKYDKKNEAYKRLYFKKDLSGFEMLMKSWWVRKILTNIDSKKLEEIDNLISFDEHMKKVISNILYIKEEKNGWNSVTLSCIEEILKEKKIEEIDLDLYFNQLVQKYKVDLNDSNFVPEKNLYFIGSYGKNN